MISSLLSETHVAENATHKCGFRPLKQCVSTRFSLGDADAIEYTKIHLSEREGIYSILFTCGANDAGLVTAGSLLIFNNELRGPICLCR